MVGRDVYNFQRQTDRDRQTERQLETDRGRETDRDRQRQTSDVQKQAAFSGLFTEQKCYPITTFVTNYCGRQLKVTVSRHGASAHDVNESETRSASRMGVLCLVSQLEERLSASPDRRSGTNEASKSQYLWHVWLCPRYLFSFFFSLHIPLK